MEYVRACQEGKWTLAIWDKATGKGQAVPYRCGSWRHAGECRDACGECDFARIVEALKRRSHWTSVVLTYPHRAWDGKRADLFRFGVVSWARLRKRLTYVYGPIEYIQTWEIHQSGYPHVNVAISNWAFHTIVRNDDCPENPPFLQELAEPCGFGPQCWATPLYDNSGMAGYLVKLALELHGHSHKDQTPVNAPRNFRRLRASRGLLPPRFHNDKITGRLYTTPIESFAALAEGVLVGPGDDDDEEKDPVQGRLL